MFTAKQSTISRCISQPPHHSKCPLKINQHPHSQHHRLAVSLRKTNFRVEESKRHVQPCWVTPFRNKYPTPKIKSRRAGELGVFSSFHAARWSVWEKPPEHRGRRGRRVRGGDKRDIDKERGTAPRPATDPGRPVPASSGLLMPQGVPANCLHTGSYRLVRSAFTFDASPHVDFHQ